MTKEIIMTLGVDGVYHPTEIKEMNFVDTQVVNNNVKRTPIKKQKKRQQQQPTDTTEVQDIIDDFIEGLEIGKRLFDRIKF